MKENKLRIFLIPLGMALLIYFGGFFTVEFLRHRKGPWEVHSTTTNNVPAVVVNQPALGIRNVMVVLDGETPPPGFAPSTQTYDGPREVPFDVPFGRVVFLDMTFLPGTVTLDLEGHAIELLPRALLINGEEFPWESNKTHHLDPANKKHPIPPSEFMERYKAAEKAKKNERP